MAKTQILDNISEESLASIFPCFNPIYRNYKRGELIMIYQSPQSDPKQIAIVKSGQARLEFINEYGDFYVLERYKSGDLFGEPFSLPLSDFEYMVTAEEDCKVVYLDYKHIITPCEKLCEHHSRLISNLFVMSAQRAQELSFHLSIVKQGSIRNKLLAYLQYARMAERGARDKKYHNPNKEIYNIKSTRKDFSTNEFFEIPMSLAELAEYIAVDRSAMMREIKTMKNDGIIDSRRREFKLLI